MRFYFLIEKDINLWLYFWCRNCFRLKISIGYQGLSIRETYRTTKTHNAMCIYTNYRKGLCVLKIYTVCNLHPFCLWIYIIIIHSIFLFRDYSRRMVTNFEYTCSQSTQPTQLIRIKNADQPPLMRNWHPLFSILFLINQYYLVN